MGQKEGVHMRRKKLETTLVATMDIATYIYNNRKYYEEKGIKVQFELTELPTFENRFVVDIWEVK